MKENRSQLAYALYADDGTGRPSGHVYTTARTCRRRGRAAPLNAWSHSPPPGRHDARLFVNGKEVSKRHADGTLAARRAARLGGNRIWSEWFKGSIDDVRVYDRALTASEIATDRRRRSASRGCRPTAREAPRRSAGGGHLSDPVLCRAPGVRGASDAHEYALASAVARLVVLAGAPAAAHAGTLHVAPGGQRPALHGLPPCGALTCLSRRAPGRRRPHRGRPLRRTADSLPWPLRAADRVRGRPAGGVAVDGLDVSADHLVVRDIESTEPPERHARQPDDPATTSASWTCTRDALGQRCARLHVDPRHIGPNHNETPHKIGGTPASHG